ncbi:unnamed protein product [Cuscuta campestris]|uniref:HTH TFE/IIEalpha-type domain-containing protein n=1 Tax=Cuscuta campestris TaxID=132261 RepID=A0A484LSE6_9ASTE|nr:unnamed protein product [Cuscuta campestris]
MSVDLSIELFNRLVRLAARAFYDDITTKGDNQPKSGRSDNRGIAVVILDALTRRQWVREEDLAKDLKLHTKQLRRTLRFFEEEKLITRDHRKESAKGAKVYNAAVAAAVDVQHNGKEDEKVKMHTHSYCCLDYAQIYDVVRYRLHRMKKKLRDELDCKNTVQEYICPNCGKRYTALDAIRLISPNDDYFHCESCNGELVAESDKFASQGMTDGDDNARRRHREQLESKLRRMEEQLKPLMELLGNLKELPVPELGSLQAWEAHASAVARGVNGDFNDNDPLKLSHGGTPMPFVGQTKVDVSFSGLEEKDVKSEGSSSPKKKLPPWMIRQGMNLTREQRGETVKQEEKMDGTSGAQEFCDDKKSEAGKVDVKNIQDEYIKAYYAAVLQRQQEQVAAAQKLKEEQNAYDAPSTSTERQVGMKSKREDDEGEDGFDWEEGIPAAAGSASGSFKVDLNVEAEAIEDEENDGLDWEEG